MRIDSYFEEFILSLRNRKALQKTARKLLTGDRAWDLPRQPGYEESEYLADNIKSSVKAAPRGKDTAIEVYREFVSFLQKKGVGVSVSFPPIPIESSFERQMFIAKYLQEEDARISDLEDLLWVSERTVQEDLLRLRGEADPLQICGRVFKIEGTERSRGQVRFASTAHPLFLTENLTQVIVMLKGLRIMAQNPLYARYAEASAADIWEQLSPYAKRRIRFVLGEVLPEDLGWYEKLEKRAGSFATERALSVRGDVWLDCIKNGKTFVVEYREDTGVRIYRDCRFVPSSFHAGRDSADILVDCREGRKALHSSRVIRSAYTIEELLGD